ncbi:hypothetical protein, variant [Aphanomyces astaci]|uniref:CSD domain-containing protein n=1 Tax=Aphanomyces astaci TaxID=112090 RepID=W4G1Y1_APHAT|nr:hypothetical protein, variant [Aphanomyces astaci]ETV73286.1 hypothetical protein, variant [Aphanomyces astaci]|eukprot:XP_009837160.1 hypothetical protein, variant [Aphanomyces astaci]
MEVHFLCAIMFRQPQSGNWADACDEDDERLTVPQQHASVPSTTNAPSSSRTDEYPSRPVVPAAPAKAPAASNYWVTRGQQAAAPAPRADTSNFRRGDDHPSSRGASYDRRDERGDYQDRRRDYDDRGGRRNYDSQDSGRFGRQDNNGRGYDRQDSNSSYGARGGGYGRDHQDSQRPAPSGRWGQAANAPRHEGFVTNFREDGGFGFLHCLELKQDVFFHESEVPARATDASTSAQQPSDTSSTLLSHVQVGDELSFELTTHPRTGKESATHIQRLAKGTIVLEDVSDQLTHGVVTKSLPPKHKPSHYHSTSSSRQSADATGTIDVVVAADSSKDVAASEATTTPAPTPLRKPIVRFNAQSFPSGSHPPRVGDDVQFRIAIHRQTGLKRAVDLTVTLSAVAKRNAAIEAVLTSLVRETGVVTSIKGGHTGTIRCLSRLQDATFAISNEEKKGMVLAEGDSVSFFVVPDELQDPNECTPPKHLTKASGRARVTAIRVEKLVDQPVVFEAVVATNVQGTVVVAPKDLSRTNGHHDSKSHTTPRGNHNGGLGQIQPIVNVVADDDDDVTTRSNPPTTTTTTLPVQWSEVSYAAKAGDVVMYDVLQDFRRGMQFAVHVRWHQLHPDGREVGTVSSLKDDFGFIKCVDRPGDAYFRVSDVLLSAGGWSSQPTLSLRQGVEVSFDVIPNPKAAGGARSDGIRAVRVQVLPKHTIVWEVVVHQQTTGVVVVAASTPSHRKSDSGYAPDGRITFQTSTCPLEPFPELRRQLQTTFADHVPDDDVALVLKQLTPAQRTALDLYARLVGLSIVVGHPSADDGKAKGEVKIVLSNRPDWTAAVAPHDADADFFAPESLHDARYELQVGDEVTCSIVRTKRGQHLVAKAIRVVKSSTSITSSGWVVLVKTEGYGFIESTDGERVYFRVTDVADKGSTPKLREGDEVTFTIKSGADRKPKAVAITKVPQGTLPPKQVRIIDQAIVARASYRSSQKSHHHHHHKKHQTSAVTSTAGKLKQLCVAADNSSTADEIADDDNQGGCDDGGEDDGGDGGRHGWMYHVEDQVDPSAVLRPGDIVTCQVVGKSKQATQVTLVSSSARTGVVELVNVQGGTIVVAAAGTATSSEQSAALDQERVAYVNKSLLLLHGGHHDRKALNVGDKVEFAIAQPLGDKPAMATHIVRVEVSHVSDLFMIHRGVCIYCD